MTEKVSKRIPRCLLDNITQYLGRHPIAKSIAGIETLKSMSVSKQWFDWAVSTWERPGPTTIINCSEAGILTEHCSLMPLSEAIFKYCNKKINVEWAIKKILK